MCSLSTLCLNNGLTTEELREFEKVVDATPKFRKGECLYRAGAPVKAVFAVKQGAFKSTLTDTDGNLQVTGFYTPGEVVGFDGLAEAHFQCDMIALTDSEVCEISLDRLDELCGRFPALRHEMSSIGSRKQNSLQQLLLLVGKRPVDERLAVFLLSMIDRYRRRKIVGNRFHLPMSRHEIANYLGMAPETLSRQFRQFESSGWITVHNKDCEIVDDKALRQLAHHCGFTPVPERLAG